MEEENIFKSIEWVNWLVMSLGVFLLFLWGSRQAKDIDPKNGYSKIRYLVPNLRNIGLQFVSAFLGMLLIHSAGEPLLFWAVQKVSVFFGIELPEGVLNNHFVEYLLSLVSGFYSGYFVSMIMNKRRKTDNIEDLDIRHVHGPECEHGH